LSNTKQMGLGFMAYNQDYDGVYPTAYFHRNWPGGGGVNGGYIHWSGLINPYVKNWGIYVCPSDKLGGHAPTCFSGNNQGFGVPEDGGTRQISAPCTAFNGQGPDDDQAPRLSYTVNSVIIPRLRNQLDVNNGGIVAVNDSEVEFPSGTIMIAELVDNLNCLNGASLGGPVRNSSHRSTNAISRDSGNRTAYFGENTDGRTTPLFALTATQALPLFDECRRGVAGLPIITYFGPTRHNGGANYTMADGSAKWRRFEDTINPQNYMWGAVVYSTDQKQRLQNPLGGVVTQR
jgi:prepilin-type processing-associated H-X9-DG protein